MYAIVEIAGQQFKVEEGKTIFVHRLELKEGENIKFDKVLLVEDEGKISIGEPFVKDAFVEGEILGDARGDKVIVFKKKRKKGYKVKNGHRQDFTRVEIVSINGKKSLVKKSVKKEAVKADEEAVTEKKTAEKKPEVKQPAAKKTTEKKPAAKKTSEKKPVAKKTSEKKALSKKSDGKESKKGKA